MERKIRVVINDFVTPENKHVLEPCIVNSDGIVLASITTMEKITPEDLSKLFSIFSELALLHEGMPVTTREIFSDLFRLASEIVPGLKS